MDTGKFFNMLSNLTSKQIDAARQDKTILAEIVEIENADNGKYRVEYQGNTFFAASTNLDVVYKKGEQVYVLVPQGDFSSQKLILGYASYKNSVEENSRQNFYLDVGSNWVGEDGIYGSIHELGICAGSTDETVISPAHYEHIGFDSNNYNTPELKTQFLKTMDEINTLSESCEYIKISGEFKTNFLSQHDKGTYGLEVHLITKAEETDSDTVEINEEQYTKSVITLGFPVFSGSPYNYSEYTSQTAYFRVPKGSIQGLIKIVLTQDGFETDLGTEVTKTIVDEVEQIHKEDNQPILNRDNIFVKNIAISFAQKINLTDTLWYAYISTPRGTRLSTQNSMVKLTPHLLYKGNDIFNPDNCEVQWFRQKADITIADVSEEDKDEHNKTWFDYGGNGWYPISKFIDDKGLIAEEDENSTTYQYSIEDDCSLIISKAAVPFQWQYKAVIIYRDNSEKEYSTQEFPLEPITIINTDSDYNITIEKYLDGLLSTFLRIRDYNKDPYGDLMASDGRPYREWFGTYWLERIDGSYERVSSEKQLGPFNINRFLPNPVIRFIVECYDPYMIDPQNNAARLGLPGSDIIDQDVLRSKLLPYVEPIANLSFDCVNIDDSELKVTWSGQDLFHYSVNGSLKTYVANRDNVIKPTLKWFSDSMSSYSLTIYGPDNQELTQRGSGESEYFTELGSENTYDCATSMMTGMYVDQDKCIHFKVREQFDQNKTDNAFKLKITLSGRAEPFEATIPISFVKDGDQGTMGAEWIAPIYPCNFTQSDELPTFSARLDSQQTIPLVVKFNPDDPLQEWQQVDTLSRLVLRPFVAKNGVKIENMDPYEGYFYRCYWDVRTPSSINNAKAKNASFLRLYRVGTGEIATGSSNTSIFSFSDALGGQTQSTRPNANENSSDGLVAKTGYPTELEQDQLQTDMPENYGAVEVRFFDNHCPIFEGDTVKENSNNTIKYKGTGASIEDMQYRFVVKCQTDIFKGQYDQANNLLHTAGDNVKVASITSFYPVDIIFINHAIPQVNEFITKIKQIQLNWPQYVEYNSSGSDPITNIDTDGLSFTIGDGDIRKQTKYLAENLTPLIQEVENAVSDSGKVIQTYKPSTHLNMTEGFCGALRTIPGQCEALFGVNDAQSFFVRNQVMYLNSFNNVDINGWDGQSIETDEDNGSIFAATLGAGFKEPTTNLFTGVVMGIDKSQKRELFKGDSVHDADYIRSHPYMTGIFGFQDGISSFGLMENGTGFFGRPDRGGRIIFDGYNATMYGGANGTMTTPSIGDPMWNSMRLSFVDLTHATNDSTVSVKGANGELIEQGFDGAYFTDSNLSNRTNPTSIPRWYKKMWQNAYIKPNGKLPYWFPKNNNDSVIKYENLFKYGEAITEEMEEQHKQNNENRKIDYYTNDSSVFTTISSKDLGTLQSALKYAKEQYELDPSGKYKTEYNLDAFYYDGAAHQNVIIEYKDKLKKQVYKNLLDKVSSANTLSGFGAARTSTTPAIEIGQHIDGLMPGILDWDDYESVFRELRIPGNRNFMVTYDGTLWAMNGVFMGTIIGSNIIGGRIQGAEIGIGTINTNTSLYTVEDQSISAANYASMLSPKEERTWTSRALLESKGGGRNLGFYVSSSGEVIANNISIYGGKIDVGHFHILGNEQEDMKERGHLIQMATSDFIGETHCYGGLTVSPSETDGIGSRSNYGNFFQTNGTVALGISKDKHNTIVSKFWNTDSAGSYSGGQGSGLIGNSFDQCCFFGLDTASSSESQYKGHFWPLSFRTHEVDGTTVAYATTMDDFANGEANYFRIGPWGTEGVQHFVKSSFQSESWCEAPDEINTLGYIGKVGTNIGIYSWGSHAIVLTAGGASTITITQDNIVFSSNGKSYSLADLAASGSSGGSFGEQSGEAGAGTVEPTVSLGKNALESINNFQQTSLTALGVNINGVQSGDTETVGDVTYRWQQNGSFLNLQFYDPKTNAYYSTGHQIPNS